LLWTDKTNHAVTEAFKELKARNHSNYVTLVEELDSYYEAVFSGYFEGESGYLNQYFPNSYNGGKGDMIPIYLKFLPRICRLKGSLFHRTPIYSKYYKGKPIEEDHEQAQIWRQIDRQARITTKLKDVDRRRRYAKTILTFVGWRNGKLNLDVLTPDVFEVYQHEDDPANLDACKVVAHELPQPIDTPHNAHNRRWLVFEQPDEKTPDWTTRILDVNGMEHPNSLFPRGINLYQAFPYVIWHETQPADSLLAPLDESLRVFQIGLNLLWSRAHVNARNAGSIPVAYTEDILKPNELAWGSDYLFKMGHPDANKVEILNQSWGAQDMLTFAQGYLQVFASMEGIHPDAFAIDGDSFSSAITAVAKSMDRADMQEERQDSEQLTEYQFYELVDKIRTVWNTHNLATNHLAPEFEIRLEWAVADAPMDPHHKEMAMEARINRGVANPIDEIMAEHGIDDPKEAEAIFEENLEIRRRLNESGPGIRQSPGKKMDPDLGTGEE
jgi:hypothetical protein